MSSGGGAHVELVEGSPQACFDAITAWASYPEWQSAVKACTVLDRDPEGRWETVETIIDARLRKVRYVLRYHYEEPSRIWWEYLEGDVKSITGDYDLHDAGSGTTRITYRLEIDAGVFVPGPIKRFLTETAMKTSVREVKARVEQVSR
jgi:ribosome-associated toxin RatA of RatAB toxin-antitoxin module